MNPSNQEFGLWCHAAGFGDMDRRERAAAMWYVQHEMAVEVALKSLSHGGSTGTELTHPRRIQEWYSKWRAEFYTPTELKDLTITEKPSVTLDQRSAEKLAKVINRANSGDEGSETAKRHVESIAKKHGVSSEELHSSIRGLLSVIPSGLPHEMY